MCALKQYFSYYGRRFKNEVAQREVFDFSDKFYYFIHILLTMTYF
jgi:hypothetical protein